MTAVENETGILTGETRMLIGGELVEAEGGRLFDVENPATEEIVGQVADGTVADMDRAIAAARKAFDTTTWSQDLEFRKHCVQQLSDALERNKERLRRIIVTEVGCPVSMTGSQIESPLSEPAHWIDVASKFNYFEDTGIHKGGYGDARRYISWEPIGVVGAITPWNTPLYLNIAETIPPLLAGNTIVLKPAQLTPYSGSELGRIIAEETDIPAGVYNVVTSNDNEVGAALSSDPRVDMITFTGSTATGRKILAAGADNVKKTVLELGGKSAHILLEDADFNSTLQGAAMMACIMSGQSCVLPSRILLPRSRYDEGVAILKAVMENVPYGDPWDPKNIQGPQVAKVQQEKVLGMIAQGVADGARLVTGGTRAEQFEKGYFVKPTLFADVDPNAMIAQDEFFGPVLVAIPYDTEDHAIEIANNSIYGLSGQVTSADNERALNVARRIRTGSVTVNGGMFFGLTSPFGGIKQSGLGRRNGVEGFAEYMESKTIGFPADA